MIPLHIIVAIDQSRGIGKEGRLPWKLSADMKYFRRKTSTARSPKKKNVVVMGRRTWDSIPEKFRPLPGRTNIILTRNKRLSSPEGVLKADGFHKILEIAENEQLKNSIETIFIIGGQQVFEEAIKYPTCNKLYVTHIHDHFDCDVFFPPFNDLFESIGISDELTENEIHFHFEEYVRKKIDS